MIRIGNIKMRFKFQNNNEINYKNRIKKSKYTKKCLKNIN